MKAKKKTEKKKVSKEKKEEAEKIHLHDLFKFTAIDNKEPSILPPEQQATLAEIGGMILTSQHLYILRMLLAKSYSLSKNKIIEMPIQDFITFP